MKTIGLLGGTAWISTIEYYRKINQKVNAKLGKNHSAQIVLRSIDYEDIKQYNYKDWGKIEDILLHEIMRLSIYNVDCIVVCNNTLHKAVNHILPHLYIDIPVIHIVQESAKHASRLGIKKVLLLGTQFTMEDGFFHEGFSSYDIEIITPIEKERHEIQRITQEELSKGIIKEESKRWLESLAKRYPCDGVIVGCTELPLLIEPANYSVPIIDTLETHCDAAVGFALST